MLLSHAAVAQKEYSCHQTSHDFLATHLWMLHAGDDMRLSLGFPSLQLLLLCSVIN
jgi:hypothetical protein